MSRYYIRQDEQHQYREGEELYHLFDREKLNEFGKPYCHLQFSTYEECQCCQRRLEAEDLRLQKLEEMKRDLAAYRRENASNPDAVHYAAMDVMNHPELMVQDIETLQYEVTRALGGYARLASVEEVEQWLSDRSIPVDLKTCEGWLIAAEAMWDEWSCTDNVGRHSVGRIISNALKADIYVADLLKAAKNRN